MTAAGSGWRQVGGIVALVSIALVFTATIYCIRCRSHQSPVNHHSHFLLYAIACSTLAFFGQPLIEAAGEDVLPCWLYFWQQIMSVALYVPAVILLAMRLICLYKFNVVKASLGKDIQRLTDEQVKLLQRSKWWFSEPALATMYFAQLPFYAALAAGVQQSDSHYTTSATGCRVGPSPLNGHSQLDRLYITWFSMLAWNTPIWTGIMWQMVRMHRQGFVDTLHFRLEWLSVFVGLAGGFLVVFVATLTDYSSYMQFWNWALVWQMTPTVHCAVFILWPVFRGSATGQAIRLTTRRYIRGRSDSISLLTAGTTCEAVLRDKRGWQFMLEQSRREFDEESMLCIDAIWRYKRAATHLGRSEIVSNYIVAGAPLQVNISSACRDRINAKARRVQPHDAAIDYRGLFEEVEHELLHLLENNTFVRFKHSELYRMYAAGEKPNGWSASEQSVSSTGSTAGRGSILSTPSSLRVSVRVTPLPAYSSDTGRLASNDSFDFTPVSAQQLTIDRPPTFVG